MTTDRQAGESEAAPRPTDEITPIIITGPQTYPHQPGENLLITRQQPEHGGSAVNRPHHPLNRTAIGLPGTIRPANSVIDKFSPGLQAPLCLVKVFGIIELLVGMRRLSTVLARTTIVATVRLIQSSIKTGNHPGGSSVSWIDPRCPDRSNWHCQGRACLTLPVDRRQFRPPGAGWSSNLGHNSGIV